jgi:hypothetical protein
MLARGALNTLFGLSLGVGGGAEVGVDALSGGSALADLSLTVRHYTSDVGLSQILGSGVLRPGTFVTLPSEIPAGATAFDIERLLEIDPGKAQNFIDFQARISQLGVPANGQLTSGGALQWQTLFPLELPK